VKIDVKSARIAGTPLSFAGDTTCPVALVVGGEATHYKKKNQTINLTVGAGQLWETCMQGQGVEGIIQKPLVRRNGGI
jgi:hypothetical protein